MILIVQDITDRRGAKSFRAHAAPQWMCDNMINALEFLATQQQGEDGPAQILVEGLQERSRLKMVEESRRFIATDNHEAIKIGDLERVRESLPVVKPNFTADFPCAVVREGGAGELALRREEEGMLRTFVDTTDVGDSRWGPPLVDEDWHAICKAIFKGVEGEGVGEEGGMGDHVLQVQ